MASLVSRVVPVETTSSSGMLNWVTLRKGHCCTRTCSHTHRPTAERFGNMYIHVYEDTSTDNMYIHVYEDTSTDNMYIHVYEDTSTDNMYIHVYEDTSTDNMYIHVYEDTSTDNMYIHVYEDTSMNRTHFTLGLHTL